MAPVALAQPAGVQVAALVVAAVRANEAVRPAQPEPRIPALVLVSVAFEKFVETEAFLELDRIAFHVYSLFNQVFKIILPPFQCEVQHPLSRWLVR